MELKKKTQSCKNFTKFLLFTLLTAYILYTPMGINSVYAQSNGNAYDEELQEELLLDLPNVTENPNYTITFTDPGGDGVTLDIDNQGEETITSPHELPTLGIGEHELVFKFSDNEEVAQTLIKEIVIIPRPPQINTPELINSKIFLSGVGVAGGKSELFITDGNDEWRVETDIDKSGAWTYDMKEKLDEGSYSVVAIARKNGYASKYSEPANFILEKSEENNDGEQTIEQRIIWDNLTISSLPGEIKKMFDNNPRVLAALLGFPLLLGIILGLLFKLLFSSKSTKRAEKMLREALDGKKEKKSKDKTIKNNKKNVSKSVLVEKLKEKLDTEKTEEKKKSEDSKQSGDDSKTSEETEPETNKKEKREEKRTKNDNSENIKEKKSDKDVKRDKKKDYSSKDTGSTNAPIDEKEKEHELTKEELEKIEEFEKKPGKERKGIFSKAEFLKKFKNFDPDDDDGKEETKKKKKPFEQEEIESNKDKDKDKKKNEKRSKKSKSKKDNTKRNISISLTSRDNEDREE